MDRLDRPALQALCKRYGLSARGSKADLLACLDTAFSKAANKGCLKHTGEAKKVTFAVEEGIVRSLRSRVIYRPVAADDADVPPRQSRRLSLGPDISRRNSLGIDVPARQPRRNSLGAPVTVSRSRRDSLGAEAQVCEPRRSRRLSLSAANAGEGEDVFVDRKRKRESVAVSTQVEVSSTVTRRSSFAGAAAVLLPAIEKRGRGKVAVEEGIVRSLRSRVIYRPVAADNADVPLRRSGRLSLGPDISRRNSGIDVPARQPRRKNGSARKNVEVPTVSDAPQNDAPVIRTLRNRIVHVNNSMLDKTRTARRSETSGKLDQSSCITGLVPNNCVVLEHKTLMNKVVEESIRAAYLGKCPSRHSIGNPPSTSLHLEAAADDTSLPVLNADKGYSSNGRPSSFEMFAEECKESYSKKAENTPVEIDGGNKPSTPVTPGFFVRSDCLEDEDVQPTECDADKKLDVDEGVAKEVLAQEESKDQHVPAKTDLNMKLNGEPGGPGMESGCSITEKNARHVADNLDEQAIILGQQGDVQEGDLKKLSLCSGTPLPEEIGGRNTPSTPVKPDFYVGFDCLEDDDVQPTGFDADKKLDVDQGVAEEEGLAQQKSNDQHVPTKTDLNMKLNDGKDNAGGLQQASNSTTLERRSSKRRRTTTSAEVRSVKEADDDAIIREATKDARKATHDYKESGSRVQESVQVNATREEHFSGPLLVTVALTDEIATVQSLPVVIPRSDFGDNANESSDKSKQEHYEIQAVDSHLSETSEKLDQSSCIAGLVPQSCIVSKLKALMSNDGLSINFTVGDPEPEEQNPISGEGRVGLEANASESGEKRLADIMSTCLYPKNLQHDINTIAEETGKVLAQEKSNDQHIPAKTELNMKLDDELAGPGTESSCITKTNTRLVADNLDQQAIFQDQQGDVQEDGQLNPELDGEEVEKHSLNCETTLLPEDFYREELEPFTFPEVYSRSGICQPRFQKHVAEANSRLVSCDTEVLHQDHKEECSKPNEAILTEKFSTAEDAPIEEMRTPLMPPSVVGKSEMPNEQVNTKLSDEREELSCGYDDPMDTDDDDGDCMYLCSGLYK